MRYRLRTLLIVLVVGPPVLAGCYFAANLLHFGDDLDQFRHPQSGIVFELYQPSR